jgi:PKD repeat protein
MKIRIGISIIGICTLLNLSDANAQTVTTVLGKQYQGSGEFTGQSNVAVADELLSIPEGVCVDNNGKIFVSDQHNLCVIDGGRSLGRGGFMGDPNEPGAVGSDDGTGIVSRFSSPTGLAAHPSTNDVFVCDRDNGMIRKSSKYVNISNPAIVSWVAGQYSFEGDHKDGAASAAYFSAPQDVEINGQGVIIISDFGNDCIRLIKSGVVSTIAGLAKTSGDATGKGTAARFNAPYGIGLESDSIVLVADRNNKKIKRLNINSGVVTNVITSGLDMPSDVVVAKGKLYIADGNCIRVWDGNNLKVYVGSDIQAGYKDGTGSGVLFNTINHLSFRKADESIYAVDMGNNVLRKITLVDAPIPSFIANNTAPVVNQTVEIKSTSTNTTGQTWTITPANYSLKAGSKLTDKVIYVAFSSTGTYSVSLTASNVSSTEVLTKNNYISVSNITTVKPTADFTADATNVLKDETVRLVDLSSNNPTTYKWTISPNTITFLNGTSPTSQFPVIQCNALGSYTVTLEATNANGTGSLTKNQYINCVVNNVEHLKEPIKELSVIPNPTSYTAVLNGVEVIKFLQVTNIYGAQVQVEFYGNKFDVSNLSAGLYFLSGLDSNNQSFKARVLVNK